MMTIKTVREDYEPGFFSVWGIDGYTETVPRIGVDRSGGYVQVYSNGTPVITTAETLVGQDVSGAEWAMGVFDNGEAVSTTLANGGNARVYANGSMNNTQISAGGYLGVNSDGQVIENTVYAGGAMVINGTAVNNTVAGIAEVAETGIVSSSTILNGGRAIAKNGGKIIGANASAGGLIFGSQGGIVSDVTISGGATLAFETGASGAQINIQDDAVLHVERGVNLTGLNMIGSRYQFQLKIDSATNTQIMSNGKIYTIANGQMASAYISDGTFFEVYAGGFVSNLISPKATEPIGGGALELYSGGTGFNIENHASGQVNVYSGGSLSSATTDTEGEIYLYGGKATNIEIGSKGYIWVHSGGFVDNLQIHPTGAATISSGGTAVGIRVSQGHVIVQESNAFVSDVELLGGGIMEVCGARASEITIQSGGLLTFSSNFYPMDQTIPVEALNGIANNIIISSGGGLVARFTGSATMVQALNGAQIQVSSASEVRDVELSSNTYTAVTLSGTLTSAKISAGAVVDIFSGGTAGWVTLDSDGQLRLHSGCLLKGGMMLNTTVYAPEDAGIEFTLTGRNASDDYLLNDLSQITGSPVFSIVVSSTQAGGIYKLAQGAAEFDRTISISTETENLGTLSVNGPAITHGECTYKLVQTDGNLTLAMTAPVVPIFTTKADVNGNGISDVMFQYTGGDYQIGFWMDGTNAWQSQNMPQPQEWDLLGAYDMGNDGKADALMCGNVTVNNVKGAYIGYYQDGDTGNWQNIGYLTNENDIQWDLAVGNITGTEGANSIVWHAPELCALGIWSDGTDTWIPLAGGFNQDWKLLGTGDFDGNNKDEVLFSYGGGLFTTDIDQNFTDLGGWGAEWDVRAIGDFSGDGKDDLILFHNEYGSVVKFADGLAENWSNVGQLDAQDWFIVGAGDYNGDQKEDLLVRQYSTGMLGYYENGDMSKWVEMGRGVDMNWTVVA